MKKVIVTLMMIFSVCVVHAENENISTSQYYVDAQSATKQDAVPANNANSVMTYDSTSADGIGSKAIYNPNASYAGQSKALVTASTANTAIQNGINNEFVCANPQGGCTLWRIKHNQFNPSKNLFDISQILTYSHQSGEQMTNNGDGSITVTTAPDNSAISTTKKLSQLAPGIVAGNRYTLSFDTTGSYKNTLLYCYGHNSDNTSWRQNTSKLITENLLDCTMMFYASGSNTTATISNIQIEEGTTATPYQPYGENTYLPQNQQ